MDILEIAFEDADQSVDEGEYHDCVVVLFGDSYHIEVIMLVEVEQVVLLILYDRLQRVFVILENLLVEGVVNVARQVRTEMTRDEHSALFVQNIYC